ncbi:hypothetical protein MTO96_026539 [Rhipicephalus appendiculatus]
MSALEWRNVAIPLEADGQFSRSSRYRNPDDPNDTRTVPCQEWDYDEQTIKSSIVSEWNIACDRRSLVTTIVLLQVYPLYLPAKCFAFSTAPSAYILIGITFLEVKTHDNRPLHVVSVGALATVTSDLWFRFVAPLDLRWASKQVVYLAPTYQLAAVLFLVKESPQLLASKSLRRPTTSCWPRESSMISRSTTPRVL